MTACIRRDYAVWTTCRCDNCATQHRRTVKRFHHGILKRTPSSAAWERLDEWTTQGFTATWIASAADIPARGIQTAIEEFNNTGHRRDFGHQRATAIAQADISTATNGRRDATGTRRRLQALAVNGWTVEALATESGLSSITLAAFQRGESRQIRPHFWRAIRDLYERLEHTPGASRLATGRAKGLGWNPPAQWDDPDTDPDPAPPQKRNEAPLDDVAIERRILGDKTVKITRQERVEARRRWIERNLGSLNQFEKHTGINSDRYKGADVAQEEAA